MEDRRDKELLSKEIRYQRKRDEQRVAREKEEKKRKRTRQNARLKCEMEEETIAERIQQARSKLNTYFAVSFLQTSHPLRVGDLNYSIPVLVIIAGKVASTSLT